MPPTTKPQGNQPPLGPLCWLCRKAIVGVVRHYQGGNRSMPSHQKCLVVVRRDPRTGGI